MKAWKPVIDDKPFVNKAKLILQKIEQKIISNISNEKEINLLRGIAGQLLFLRDYSDKRTTKRYTELLLKIISSNNSLFNTTLGMGLAGIGFSLKIVNEKYLFLDDNVLPKLFDYVRKMIKKFVDLDNFDFLHGFMGQGYFLLQEDHNAVNLEIFNSIITKLRQLTYPQEIGIGWINEKALWKIYPKSSKPEDLPKDCDLGIAHGIPGIVMILTRMHQKYPELNCNLLIDTAVSFLFNEELEENKKIQGLFYKSYSGKTGEIHMGPKLAWCYSDLGISLIYFNLWEITSRLDFFYRANHLAISCAQKRMGDTPIISSGLCHGVSGIAYMFSKIYNKTENIIFKEAANYWFSILFDYFIVMNNDTNHITSFSTNRITGVQSEVNNGFLEGLSGIGLAINSAISNKYPSWDQILLI